jgi:hypothetical protein
MTVVGCGTVTALLNGVEREAESQKDPARCIRDPLGDRGQGSRTGQDACRGGRHDRRQRETPTTTVARVGQARGEVGEAHRVGQRLR